MISVCSGFTTSSGDVSSLGLFVDGNLVSSQGDDFSVPANDDGFAKASVSPIGILNGVREGFFQFLNCRSSYFVVIPNHRMVP
jgi:hypothetical protein